VVPTALQRRRIVRIAKDEESGVMHRLDQASDKRVQKPGFVLGLVRAAQPAADPARPRVLADSLAL
jgi:hypothetical protein